MSVLIIRGRRLSACICMGEVPSNTFLPEWSVFAVMSPWVRAAQFFFFAAAALTLAALFLLLRIMTMERKEPTTAEPTRMRMTGMRMAQTRGGKRLWRKWSSSTKGWE